jgi:replicative DNA helicase
MLSSPSFQFNTSPLQNLLNALERVGCPAKRQGRGYRAQCPCCKGSRNDKLGINECDDGTVVVNCFGACETTDIVKSLGLELRDLFCRTDYQPQNSKATNDKRPKTYATVDDAVAVLAKTPGLTFVKRWDYPDAKGQHVASVSRLVDKDGKKTYKQSSRLPNGRWANRKPDDPRPLYRLPSLAAAEHVWIFEGEKCADAAVSLGLTATTSLGGCGQAKFTDWSPLSSKRVTICPDSGKDGRKYLREVADLLRDLDPPAQVDMVDLGFTESNLDIVDWLEKHDAVEPETLVELLLAMHKPIPEEEADVTSDDSELTEMTIHATKWLESFHQNEGPRLFDTGLEFGLGPGVLVIVGAKPKVGKTTLVMQLLTNALFNEPDLRAMIVSIEMTGPDLVEKQTSQVSGTNARILRYHKELLTREDRAKITAAIDKLRPIHKRIFTLNQPRKIEDFVSVARKHKPDIVVLDYVQRIKSRLRPTLDERSSINLLVDESRLLCEGGCCVIAVSSLNRSGTRSGKHGDGYDRISLDSFRESGELEYGADECFGLRRAKGSRRVYVEHLAARFRPEKDFELHVDDSLYFHLIDPETGAPL